MKKIKSLNKIILMLAVVAMICGICVTSKASTAGDIDDIFQMQVINTSSTPNTVQSVPTQSVPAKNTVNNSLPKTGINDTVMWVAIAGCVVLAVYTYKKVRDYNV